uniref:Uncharacterized protein n=1 Tax=Arundo donax TaxID=35708 RepID=A0A0A9BR57_ARUDO
MDLWMVTYLDAVEICVPFTFVESIEVPLVSYGKLLSEDPWVCRSSNTCLQFAPAANSWG